MDECKDCKNASMEKCLMCKHFIYIKNSEGISKEETPKKVRKKKVVDWDEESVQGM